MRLRSTTPAAMAVLATCLWLPGCPKQQTEIAHAPPVITAQAETPPPPAPEKTSPGADEPQWQKKPAEETEGSPHGDAYTSNKTRDLGSSPNDEALERELEHLRPKKKRERESLFGTMVELEFTEATLNEAPNTHLHNLSFKVSDGDNVATATLRDKEREVAMTINLGWGGVKFKPVAHEGKIKPIGQGTVRNRVERAGSWELVFLDAAGKAMGTAQINMERRLLTRDGKPGYSVTLRSDPEFPDGQILHVNKGGKGEKPTKMMLVRWHDGSAQIHELRDKIGNEFFYKFPVGRIEVINPDD